ncbi:MAG TPA: SHOCT domain-containing protein [Kofleriaceae bacterium]
MMKTITATVALVGLAGCTTWGTTNVYGPKREIGRQLLGSPAIAESKSSSLNAGFSGQSGGGIAVAGLSGATDSIKLTHCVQQAEIQYEQPFEIHPTTVHRGYDVAGALTLGIIGLIVIGSTSASQDTFWQPGDPYYEPPPDPTAGYAIGGAMVGAGAGLLIYSFAKLPKQPRPVVQQSRREWVESRLVESTGCAMGLPQNVATAPAPAPQPAVAPAPAANDVTARLQKLDSLKASGAITDAEYQRKRKEIIDGI